MFDKPKALEFFAGSGLVRQGIGLWFNTVWANDICQKKADIYEANFGKKELVVRTIEKIEGRNLPAADLAWASFPCQDLSLAGNLAGLQRGSRSGMFWEFLRVLDEIPEQSKPSVLTLENVVGWLVSKNGGNFTQVYRALKQRGYIGGAVVINANHFVPQSRPRAFLIAVKRSIELGNLVSSQPDPTFHTKSVLTAANAAADKEWIWWNLTKPAKHNRAFSDVCEWDAECDDWETTQKLLRMLSPRNQAKLKKELEEKSRKAGTGYKRTRQDNDGNKVQRLEIRFDDLAGCLRTPGGGSSRQTVLLVEKGKVRTRLMTVRETARLMGAPDDFKIPGSYNEGYKAMGDAVCAPVAAWLAEYLLSPLCMRSRDTFIAAAE